jgi:hypothetical protein
MRSRPNNPPLRKVRPRITLIIAVDSVGNLFASMLQANSDSDTMALFMKELVARLDYEDKQWRKNSLIVWDGAGYHTSKEILKCVEELQVPLMRLGPYSYLMQPAELVFASLKSVKLIDQD